MRVVLPMVTNLNLNPYLLTALSRVRPSDHSHRHLADGSVIKMSYSSRQTQSKAQTESNAKILRALVKVGCRLSLRTEG